MYNAARLLAVFSFFLVLQCCAGESAGQELKQYERYVKRTLRNYDKDKDGFLDEKELKQLRRPPVDADSDGDDRVSKQEYVDYFLKKSSKKQGGRVVEKVKTKSKIRGDVDVWLLKKTVASDESEILPILNKSTFDELSSAIKSLEDDGKVEVTDRFATTVAHRQQTKISGGVNKQVVVSTTRGRNGVQSRHFNDVQVGSELSVLPDITGEEMELSFQKQDFNPGDLESDTPVNKATSITFSNSVVFKSDGVTAMLLETEGTVWVLVVGTRSHE